MKKVLLILALILTLSAACLAFTACGEDDGISFKTFEVNGTNVYGRVPNDQTTFNFANEVEVSENAEYVVSLDISGIQTAMTKIVELEIGDNIFYVVETIDDETTAVYTVVIHRNEVYEVSFVAEDVIAAETQYIEEGFFATEPTANVTTKLGYDFVGWDFDFTKPITGDVVVKAKIEVKDEMKNFEFTSTTTSCEITGLNDKTVTEITIPNYVTSIGERAFSYCTSLESVTIPDSVTSIGWEAFSGCYKLVEVINHSSLDIEAGSYDYGYVGYYAKEVHKGESKIVNYNDYLFYTYDGLNYLLGYVGEDTALVLPESYNGENYEIYNFAFYYCTSLTSVTIGNSVTSIGNYAFYYCTSLTSVTIPNSVTSIGNDAFRYCYKLVEIMDLSSLNITKGNSSNGYVGYYAIEVHKGESKIVNYNDYLFFTYDGVNYLFGYVGEDTALVLPESYNGENYEIYNYALYERRDITSVTIPDSVTSIGSSAFYDCSSLTSVTIGNSVTSIGSSAFSNCYKLVEVINHSSLNITAGSSSHGYVGYYAKEVHKGESKIVNFNDYLFYTYDGVIYLLGYVGKDTALVLPESYKGENYEIYKYAFYQSNDITSVTIGNGVTSIGDYAFRNCTGLTSVTIGNSVTSIGEDAFRECTSLTSVTIGNSVTSIGNYAFYYCTNLTSVTIPNSVISIGYYAFAHCDSLTSVTIGNSVTSIGEDAFYNCSNLTSVTIPDSVTSIGEDAFLSCTGLTIYCEAASEPSGWSSYWNSSNRPVVWAHNNITSNSYYDYVVHNEKASLTKYKGTDTEIIIPSTIGGYAVVSFGEIFKNNTSITSVVIPNSVTSIGSSAFEGCTGLKSVTIPDSVTSIGYSAFSGCTSLTSVTIPDSVTSIGNDAFYRCTSLTIYCEATSQPSGWDSRWNYSNYPVVWGYKG